MLSEDIPKDIRDFKEKIVLGLTVRQLFSSAVAVIICVPFYLWSKEFIGEDAASWIVMLIALPCAGVGFFKKNGMVFEQYVLSLFKHEFLYPKKRIYVTENCFREWNETVLKESKIEISKMKPSQRKVRSLERALLMEEMRDANVK